MQQKTYKSTSANKPKEKTHENTNNNKRHISTNIQTHICIYTKKHNTTPNVNSPLKNKAAETHMQFCTSIDINKPIKTHIKAHPKKAEEGHQRQTKTETQLNTYKYKQRNTY